MNFGPQYFYASRTGIDLSVLSGGAQFFPLNIAWNGRRRRIPLVVDGCPLEASPLPRPSTRYLDDFYAGIKRGPASGCAVPGFHDIYQEAGVQPSYGYLTRVRLTSPKP